VAGRDDRGHSFQQAVDGWVVADVEGIGVGMAAGQEVAEQLPGGLFGEPVGVAGAFEVDEEAIDKEVGVGGDADAREGRAAVAVAGCGALAQGCERAVGGFMDLGDDVVHQVLVGQFHEALAGERFGLFARPGTAVCR
jgi:hypothetical protein